MKEKTLSEKEYKMFNENGFKTRDVKEAANNLDKFLIKKYAEERTTHKSHGVQSLLIEIRQEVKDKIFGEFK